MFCELNFLTRSCAVLAKVMSSCSSLFAMCANAHTSMNNKDFVIICLGKSMLVLEVHALAGRLGEIKIQQPYRNRVHLSWYLSNSVVPSHGPPPRALCRGPCIGKGINTFSLERNIEDTSEPLFFFRTILNTMFLGMSRGHEGFWTCYHVRMAPTSLSYLFQPFRTLNSLEHLWLENT